MADLCLGEAWAELVAEDGVRGVARGAEEMFSVLSRIMVKKVSSAVGPSSRLS